MQEDMLCGEVIPYAVCAICLPIKKDTQLTSSLIALIHMKPSVTFFPSLLPFHTVFM